MPFFAHELARFTITLQFFFAARRTRTADALLPFFAQVFAFFTFTLLFFARQRALFLVTACFFFVFPLALFPFLTIGFAFGLAFGFHLGWMFVALADRFVARARWRTGTGAGDAEVRLFRARRRRFAILTVVPCRSGIGAPAVTRSVFADRLVGPRPVDQLGRSGDRGGRRFCSGTRRKLGRSLIDRGVGARAEHRSPHADAGAYARRTRGQLDRGRFDPAARELDGGANDGPGHRSAARVGRLFAKSAFEHVPEGLVLEHQRRCQRQHGAELPALARDSVGVHPTVLTRAQVAT